MFCFMLVYPVSAALAFYCRFLALTVVCSRYKNFLEGLSTRVLLYPHFSNGIPYDCNCSAELSSEELIKSSKS